MSRVHRRDQRAVALAVALFLVSCDVPQVPDEAVVPLTIGIVTAIEQDSEGVRVTLEGGGSLLLPSAAEEIAGKPQSGDLLIVGGGEPAAPDGGVWYASLQGLPSGCYRIVANGEIRGDRMALSDGFSLPLSDEWDETDRTFVSSPMRGFCLDDEGAVVRPYS